MHIPIPIHKGILYSLTAVALLSNCLLLLLLLHTKGKLLGQYRYLLASFAVTDIAISLYHAWYVPIVLLGSYGYVFFGYGTLTGRGFIARHAVVIYTCTFYLPFYVLCAHFVYRTLVMARPTLVRERFRVFMVLYVTIAAVYTAVIGSITSSVCGLTVPARFHGFLAEYGITLDSSKNYVVIDHLDENLGPNYHTIFTLLAGGCLGSGPLAISVWCIWRISSTFKSRAFDVKTRLLHVQLFRALLIQFAVPVLFSLLPFSVIILLPITGLAPAQAGNVCCLLVSVFPALDPLLVILSFSRFRTTIVEWVDILWGRTAARNEEKAWARSRIDNAIKRSEHIFLTQKIIFIFSLALNVVVILCTVKTTARKANSKLILIQVQMMLTDAMLELVIEPLPLFPMIGGYCCGWLSRIGLSVQHTFVYLMTLLASIAVSIMMHVIHRHQSILFAAHPLKLRKSAFPCVGVMFFACFCTAPIIFAILPKDFDEMEQIMDEKGYTWIRDRNCVYLFQERTPLILALILCMIFAVISSTLLLLVMCGHLYAVLNSQTNQRSARSVFTIRRSLLLLFIQLIIPFAMLAVPAVVIFIGMAAPEAVSFELSFAMYCLITLHSIGHNLGLLSINPKYRKCILDFLRKPHNTVGVFAIAPNITT